MNIVFYSNCQGNGLKFFLEKVFKNSNFYIIKNYELIMYKRPLPKKILNSADILIYQPLINKGIYSTDSDNMLSLLPKKCIKISFPYIYNDSLWILLQKNSDRVLFDKIYLNKDFTQNEIINKESIEILKERGMSLNEVMVLYRKGKIDFKFEKRFNRSISILKEREQKCDIKVADFILENFKKHKLFLTHNHPTTCVFIHCVNQLLSILNNDTCFNLFEYNNNVVKLPGTPFPHTSYEKKFWNLSYNDDFQNDEIYIDIIKYIYHSY